MAFLKKSGASGRFTFDVIYSCLQKSLRRGNMEIALEMVKEFRDYPNALKKRLIYCCCEDCPNLYLIRDIYNTPAEMKELTKFIPIICNHVKCREVIMTFRAACQADYVTDDFNIYTDTVWTVTKKIFYKLCQNDNDVNELIKEYQSKSPKLNDTKEWKLITISNFINKCRTVLFAMIAFNHISYVTVQKYKDNFDLPNTLSDMQIDEILKYKFDDKWNYLPTWVYDKHCHSSPPGQRTYEFFGRNLLLVPRMEETIYEKIGLKLYMKTDTASGDYIQKVKNPSKDHNPGLFTAKDVLDDYEYKLLLNDGVDVVSPKSAGKMISTDDEDEVPKKSTKKKSTKKVVSDDSDDDISSKTKTTNPLPPVRKFPKGPINIVSKVQVQCITGAYKPRTYFAKLEEGDTYPFIIKGPYRSKGEPNDIILSDKLKTLFELNSPQSKLFTQEAGAYLLSFNMATIRDPIHTIIRTTKLEDNVTIYNGDLQILNDKLILSYPMNTQLELHKILFFRKLIGTNDTCNRNIIVNKDNFICCSIDDPAKFVDDKGVMFKKPLEKHLAGKWKTSLKSLWPEVKSYIDRCRFIIANNKNKIITNDMAAYMLKVCNIYDNIDNWKF